MCVFYSWVRGKNTLVQFIGCGLLTLSYITLAYKMWRAVVLLVVLYATLLVVLRTVRVVKPRRMRLKPRTQFPVHVRLRGFASAAFQERGGYASDTDTHRLDGVWTDWSWRKPAPKPPWASGALPMLFHMGNGASTHLEHDLALMRAAGATMYRFSLCWPRLQSAAFAPLDETEVAYLQHTLARVRAHGMVPMITVLHFVLPEWHPGWLSDQAIALVRDLVTRVSHVLPKVDEEYWITVNEPNIWALHSYMIGTRPPGQTSLHLALKAYTQMLRAHAAIARILHRRNAHASPACNLSLFAAHTPASLLDQGLATTLDALFNRTVLELLTNGQTRVLGTLVRAPKSRFIAVNTYTRITTRCVSLFEQPDIDHEALSTKLPNDLRWDVGSQYLYDVLTSVHRFAPRARVLVSEHGVPDCHDVTRCKLLAQVCSVLHECPFVVGYLVWTFTRNVEWDIAPAGDFGVVDVDFRNNFERVPRPSYHLLSRLWS